jgi:hypothetical protein
VIINIIFSLTMPKKIYQSCPKPKSSSKSSLKETDLPKRQSVGTDVHDDGLDVQTKSNCSSIKSNTERHSQCLFKAIDGSKYCPLHQLQSKPIDYEETVHEIIQDIASDADKLSPSELPSNPVVGKLSLTELNKTMNAVHIPHINHVTPGAKLPSKGIKMPSKKGGPYREQTTRNVMNNYEMEETELEIKLLILVNDEEYIDKIPKLIGPVFNDVTISEDEVDPVTLDPIWISPDGLTRRPSTFNRYYLFSYVDSKGKIRCLTIFTLQEILNSESCVHPITTEPIPEEALKRGKKLVSIYSSKLGLFRDMDDSMLSPEYKLKNRISKLFAKFHIHSIYLEDTWLMNLDDIGDLYKIITETGKLVSNNRSSINPNNVIHPKMFQRKRNSSNKKNNGSDDLTEIKEYIVTEWENLITFADNPQNQIPIWIIASGLSFVIPDVKQKYPNLEIML